LQVVEDAGTVIISVAEVEEEAVEGFNSSKTNSSSNDSAISRAITIISIIIMLVDRETLEEEEGVGVAVVAEVAAEVIMEAAVVGDAVEEGKDSITATTVVRFKCPSLTYC
jgi:hypothetical protein